MRSNNVFQKLFVASIGFVLALPSGALAESGERYIVIGKDREAFKAHMKAKGAAVSHDLKYHSGFVARMPESVAEALKVKFGSDILVEKDGEARIMGFKVAGKRPATQPAQESPWGIGAIRATEAQATARGAGSRVCVVDTGVQPDHPDLQANIAGGENFILSKGVVNPANWKDDNGHGTHVSGTIAAVNNGIGVIGVAPEAKIFAVKALNRQGSGSYSGIAEGVRSCISNGAHVINMSLGGTTDSAVLHQAIKDARSAGLLIIAAAGNESTSVSYPAKYPEVIAVSAVDSAMKLAYFSNTGPEVAFAAPGVSVYSTVNGSGYDTYSGTSMASPHVAGVAALMVSAGSLGLLASDIGLTLEQQGDGLIDALKTVLYQEPLLDSP